MDFYSEADWKHTLSHHAKAVAHKLAVVDSTAISVYDSKEVSVRVSVVDAEKLGLALKVGSRAFEIAAEAYPEDVPMVMDYFAGCLAMTFEARVPRPR